MSRRTHRAELALTCRACGSRDPVAAIHIDDDGDPVLTASRHTVDDARYSLVHDLHSPPERPDVPNKVTLFCVRGHELQINLQPLIAELEGMDARRVRRPI